MTKWSVVSNSTHFILVDKPSGYLSVPSRMGEEDPRPCLGLLLQQELGQQIYPTHRLDFEVSGLILFAKTEAAHRAANKWFENKWVRKTYSAQSEGYANTAELPQHFTWKSKLLRGKKRAYESPAGKLAITEATLLAVDRQTHHLSWQLLPITGRSHQLRYEMAKRQFPILGDKLYGSTHNYYDNAIALRALQIEFSENCRVDEFELQAKYTVKDIL